MVNNQFLLLLLMLSTTLFCGVDSTPDRNFNSTSSRPFKVHGDLILERVDSQGNPFQDSYEPQDSRVFMRASRKLDGRKNETTGIIGTVAYTDALNTTGWSILKINTFSTGTDEDQFFVAGYLEGYITANLINDAYYNFLNSVLEGNQLSSSQQEFITQQTEWLREQSSVQRTSPYWSLVRGLLKQIDGLYEGYLKAMSHQSQPNNSTLTFDQFYYLTNMGDLEDIQNAFLGRNKTEQDCDSFVLIGDGDLICAHNTFNIYMLMLRIYKVYDFQLSNKAVRAQFQAFSSRPGDLESKDDFYTLSSNLVVLETSLNNYNQSNYQYLHYDSVPCWMRVNIANRLAENASDWARIFEINRSGTHNNQWFVVDYNKWSTGSTEGIVWMVEESFYFFSAFDFTSQLLKQNYVASYNVPYNQSIYNETMYGEGYGYTYWNDPRALLFANHTIGAKSTGDAMRIIRSNRNTTGDPVNALSPRQDVLPSGGYPFGGIDGKVVNSELLSKREIYMISGPTQDGFPAFNWADWEDFPHRGMPDLYDNDWIRYELDSNSIHGVVESKMMKIEVS